MTDDGKHLEENQAFEEDELEPDERDAEDEADESARLEPARRTGRSAQAGLGGPRRDRGAASGTRTTKARGVIVDPSLRIRDRVSEAFVIGTLVVFGAILAYALAFGHGGAFTVIPTPAPAIASPVPSGSVGPSGSPAESPSIAPSPSAAPLQSAAPGASSSPAAGASPAAS